MSRTKVIDFVVRPHGTAWTFEPHVYFGMGADIPKQLAAAKVAARQARLAGNRAVRCQRCSEPVARRTIAGEKSTAACARTKRSGSKS